MLDIFTAFTDLILPPPEAVRILRKETPDSFIRFFSPEQVAGTIALSSFHTPLVHAAIVANKFQNHDKAAVLLGNLLKHWLLTLPPCPTYLIPLPLGKERERSRGYNQVKRVLDTISVRDTKTFTALERIRDTVPQTSLEREARFHNMKDAFALAQPLTFAEGARLILCDDVITTGATLHAARQTLTAHLPPQCELITVAFAH